MPLILLPKKYFLVSMQPIIIYYLDRRRKNKSIVKLKKSLFSYHMQQLQSSSNGREDDRMYWHWHCHVLRHVNDCSHLIDNCLPDCCIQHWEMPYPNRSNLSSWKNLVSFSSTFLTSFAYLWSSIFSWNARLITPITARPFVTSKHPINTNAVGNPSSTIPVSESMIPSVPLIYCCVPSTGSIHIPMVDKSIGRSFGICSNDCFGRLKFDVHERRSTRCSMDCVDLLLKNFSRRRSTNEKKKNKQLTFTEQCKNIFLCSIKIKKDFFTTRL